MNGFVAKDEEDFVKIVLSLVKNPQRLSALGEAAHRSAREYCWKRVFEKLFEYYKMGAGFSKGIRA